MRIFISYRRADSIGHAGRLFDDLQARFGRDNVFMDLTGIDAGENFVDKLDSAVQSCDALVAVIGDEWLSSVEDGTRRLDRPDDFVRAEIAAALARGIPVVPVLVEGATMPSAKVLPGPLQALAVRNAHELSDARWSYDIDRLGDALEKLAPSRPWYQRPWVQFAAAVAIAALAAAVFLIPTAPEPAAVPSIAGEWSADVTYGWGAKYRERFSLRVADNEIIGTASFLGVARGIVSGTVNDSRITFETRTQEVLGDWNNPREVVHRYRGQVSGDQIAFTMQSEGASSDVPVDFTATRVRADEPEQPRP
jgi:hypothetical protein